jgi:glucosamine--fructose-6-phosphate aminotransferase (isomerizing)
VVIVHNGIIENYKELKEMLAHKGHTFVSETDSEIVANLIAEKRKTAKSLVDAVTESLKELRGTYGLAIMAADEPGTIIAARMGSPLVLGIGESENFIASDPTPIMRHTKNVIYLNDGEIAIVTGTSYDIFTLAGASVARVPEAIDWTVEAAEKGGYEHYMEKEMMEIPEVIENTMLGRVILEEGRAKLGGLIDVAEKLKSAKRIIIVGCGTAYYAGLVGEYLIESLARVPVEVELASEFRYRNPVIEEGTIVLAVSQSGETIDTLEAMREGKRRGALTLGIVNVVGSTIARESDAGVYNHAGPEIGVASTKAFVSQLVVLALFALHLGREREMSEEDGHAFVKALTELPNHVRTIQSTRGLIEKIAPTYATTRDFLYIGRKQNYPTALEGALKLKEISYVHAEGYSAGEMKHGPLAMIDKDFPTVAIAPQDSVYEKMVSNIEEIKARSGRVFAILTEGDVYGAERADDAFFIPKTHEYLSPILAVIPLQFFAYYISLAKGLPIDKPRNLAKSVTVE